MTYFLVIALLAIKVTCRDGNRYTEAAQRTFKQKGVTRVAALTPLADPEKA
jgi:hypothetical protein